MRQRVITGRMATAGNGGGVDLRARTAVAARRVYIRLFMLLHIASAQLILNVSVTLTYTHCAVRGPIGAASGSTSWGHLCSRSLSPSLSSRLVGQPAAKQASKQAKRYRAHEGAMLCHSARAAAVCAGLWLLGLMLLHLAHSCSVSAMQSSRMHRKSPARSRCTGNVEPHQSALKGGPALQQQATCRAVPVSQPARQTCTHLWCCCSASAPTRWILMPPYGQ